MSKPWDLGSSMGWLDPATARALRAERDALLAVVEAARAWRDTALHTPERHPADLAGMDAAKNRFLDALDALDAGRGAAVSAAPIPPHMTVVDANGDHVAWRAYLCPCRNVWKIVIWSPRADGPVTVTCDECGLPSVIPAPPAGWIARQARRHD